MSASMDISFNSGMGLEDTVRDLQQLLFIDFTREGEGDLVRYRHVGLGYALTLVADHGLVNDCGIQFEKYKYACMTDVVEQGVRGETSAALRHDMAMYFFDMIVQGRRWPAMVVFNVQHLIESFEPKPEGRLPN